MAEKDYTSLFLRSQICFPLYACSREIIKQYRPHLEALGLTYTQYITMMVVWEMQEISVKALGQQLHLDSGTLTPVLKALEAKGLLTRRRSPEDERVLLVSVTEEGMALREQALSVPRAMAGCARLTEDEAATLYQLLYKLLDSTDME
ncbi:MAG: MarR family transcriptional regulator [Oscillospiraceae bacterium]|nr:MarR family transcriptional regulator [Oscillospiraceae bacterium]